MAKKQGTPEKPAAKPRAKRSRRTAQPRYAAAAKIRAQVLELRTLGLTIAQIAERVGRAPSVVHTHLKHALEEMDAEQREQSDRMRALAFGRLEKVLARAMLGAIKGDVKCMREVQRCILAQARLMGWMIPAARNPETGVPLGDGDTGAGPGRWTLPGRPDVDLVKWQEQAEAVWEAQQQRNAAD